MADIYLQGIPLSAQRGWKNNSLQTDKTIPTLDKLEKSNHKEDIKSASGQPAEQTCFTDMACSTAHVSAFCRAAISKVIPRGFWGNDENQRVILFWVDQFVSLRKFESLTLHQVTQKLQVFFFLKFCLNDSLVTLSDCISSLAPVTRARQHRQVV